MPYNIDFTQLADNGDYTLPDWSYPVGDARIVSGRWQAQWPEVYAYYTPPVATSGVMTVSLTQNGDEQMSGDVVCLGWCDALGNGIVARINGGTLAMYELIGWTQTNNELIRADGSFVYPASSVFTAELDKTNGTLRILLDGVLVTSAGSSDFVETGLQATSWKPVIASSWDNTAARGVTTLAVAGEAAGANTAPVIDSSEPNLSISTTQTGVVATVNGNASDADGDPLTYSIVSGAPAGFTMATNGEISANGSVAAGTYTITYQASDGTDTVQDTFELTVVAGMLVVSAGSTMQRGANYQITIQDPPITPTTSNTSLVSGNDSLACTLVEDLGNAQYRLTFAVGDLSKQVNATGYNWSVRVENS